MSSQEANKAVVRRFYAEMDAGNLEVMDELVAEDYIDHNPPPFPGVGQGRAGLKQAFEIFWTATPGRHEIEDQVAEGDKVVTRLGRPGMTSGFSRNWALSRCHEVFRSRSGRSRFRQIAP
jgi:predicted SnoaL-like aldol condensation-catalyzing enzyme